MRMRMLRQTVHDEPPPVLRDVLARLALAPDALVRELWRDMGSDPPTVTLGSPTGGTGYKPWSHRIIVAWPADSPAWLTAWDVIHEGMHSRQHRVGLRLAEFSLYVAGAICAILGGALSARVLLVVWGLLSGVLASVRVAIEWAADRAAAAWLRQRCPPTASADPWWTRWMARRRRLLVADNVPWVLLWTGLGLLIPALHQLGFLG